MPNRSKDSNRDDRQEKRTTIKHPIQIFCFIVNKPVSFWKSFFRNSIAVKQWPILTTSALGVHLYQKAKSAERSFHYRAFV
jgi:hypothetical protein